MWAEFMLFHRTVGVNNGSSKLTLFVKVSVKDCVQFHLFLKKKNLSISRKRKKSISLKQSVSQLANNQKWRQVVLQWHILMILSDAFFFFLVCFLSCKNHQCVRSCGLLKSLTHKDPSNVEQIQSLCHFTTSTCIYYAYFTMDILTTDVFFSNPIFLWIWIYS